MKFARSRGFTLIEAMIASVIVAVGVTSALRGYSALTRAQTQIQERDRMQRLAVSKYDELLAIGLSNAPTNGDFQDYRESRYKWELSTETTSTTGLDMVQVTVTAVNPSDMSRAQVSGLVYTPQTTATTTAGGAG